jgi:hypothetical protein
MAHKVIVPQKKIRSQSFLSSGTLIVNCSWRKAVKGLLNRVPEFLSNRLEWLPTLPPRQASVSPPTWVLGEATFACGGRGTNSDDWTANLVLYI